MKLEINDRMLFKEIQEVFHKMYPYLWIDFYQNAAHQVNHARPEMVNAQMPVRSLSTFEGTQYINIAGTNSVAQLEKEFWEKLNLKVKVLRRSGNVWVGTSYTNNWTLENQNSEGQQIIIE